MANKKILLVGGGTGGHAGPVLAVYDKLRQTDSSLELLVVGTGSVEERHFFSRLPRLKIISSGKLHRYLTLKNVVELSRLLKGIFQSYFLLISFKPKMIFLKGGYSSMPIVLIAKLLRVPYYIHESDIEMGKVNSFMAKSAKKVFVAYPNKFYGHVERAKLVFSGPILRQNFLNKDFTNPFNFGFNDRRTTIFFTSGSQGSLSIANKFVQIGKKLLSEYNIIYQAGKHSINKLKEFQKSLTEVESGGFFLREMLGPEAKNDLMVESVGLADLVVARAGSTILEIAILEKPMLLIPWQHSAGDHQVKNALYFRENDASEVLFEQEMTADDLYVKIKKMLSDRSRLKVIAENSNRLVPNDGLELICKEIIEEMSR